MVIFVSAWAKNYIKYHFWGKSNSLRAMKGIFPKLQNFQFFDPYRHRVKGTDISVIVDRIIRKERNIENCKIHAWISISCGRVTQPFFTLISVAFSPHRKCVELKRIGRFCNIFSSFSIGWSWGLFCDLNFTFNFVKLRYLLTDQFEYYSFHFHTYHPTVLLQPKILFEQLKITKINYDIYLR